MPLEVKREYVRDFFSDTGATYDKIVQLCTFGVDSLWKRRILDKLGDPFHVLDLACGTGILSFAIAQRFPHCQVMGVDITQGYLEIARGKKERFRAANVQFVQGWAEEYRSNEQFNCITSSYLAKYADLPRLVIKLWDMLRPGGTLLFHDFTYPRNRVLASAWEVHFKLLQNIGARRYPEWREVFHSLPELVRKTQWVKELTESMNTVGFSDIHVESLTLQGATLVTARRESLSNTNHPISRPAYQYQAEWFPGLRSLKYTRSVP